MHRVTEKLNSLTNTTRNKLHIIGVGDGEGKGARAPLKFGKIFLGQLLCKIRAFFGQNSYKIWELC